MKFEVPCFSSRGEAEQYAKVTLGVPADALVVEILVIGAGLLLVGGAAVAAWYVWGKGWVAEPDNEIRERRKAAIETELSITDDHLSAALIRASSFITDEEFEKALAELQKKGNLEKVKPNSVRSVRQVLKIFKPLGVKVDKEAVKAEWDRMVEAGKSGEDDEEKEKPKSDADRLVTAIEKGFQRLTSLLPARRSDPESDEDPDLKARSIGLGERIMSIVERFIPKEDTPEEPKAEAPDAPEVNPLADEPQSGKSEKVTKPAKSGKKGSGKKNADKPPVKTTADAGKGAEASG